jgi:hemerythrin superfamily protein
VAKGRTVQEIDSTHGVVQYLTEQHRHIRSLFDEVGRAAGPQRADSFLTLRRLLAVHETAEELVVHPRARWRLPDGDPVSSPRLQEEERAKRMVVALEKLPVDSAEFQAGLTRLREAVLAHAEAEEREEFSRLVEVLGERELARMRSAARLAEALAPTRAHPSAIFAAENVIVGGFTALLDRFRDLISHPDAGDGSS